MARKQLKMAIVSPYLGIIALNVNGLNSSINRHGWTDLKKQHTAHKRPPPALKHIYTDNKERERQI